MSTTEPTYERRTAPLNSFAALKLPRLSARRTRSRSSDDSASIFTPGPRVGQTLVVRVHDLHDVQGLLMHLVGDGQLRHDVLELMQCPRAASLTSHSNHSVLPFHVRVKGGRSALSRQTRPVPLHRIQIPVQVVLVGPNFI